MAKNIILLADGTGNSAASPFKTNVWRLYQALDLTGGDQVASYDDGVGTESLKPLKALGGALGLGVWKNAKDLYTFLCRNYVDGDQIYLFGFSRGAFTARLLAGLIVKCGIVKAATEDELRRCVALSYSAFRRDFLYRAMGAPRRWGMKWLLLFLKRPDYAEGKIDLRKLGVDQRAVKIRFIGVWDTVDAYGMPVDEWKRGIDQIVWPMSFADRDLSDDIVQARHAMSLDDERVTFRPVLWSEVDPKTNREIPRDRLLQVWFAGVHTNVGGGYPDDGMAYVALDWMMSETSLKFLPAYRADVPCRADPNGRQYDSRAGLAGYYRYGPRNVARLCHDALYGVTINDPIFHASVLARVGEREVACAPISAPLRLSVVKTGSNVLTPQTPVDKHWMELAWDQVWWRQVVYLLTVLLTVILVLFPVLEKAGILAKVSGWLERTFCGLAPDVCTSSRSIFSSGFHLVGTNLPELVSVTIPNLITRVVPDWSVIWVRSFLHFPIFALIVAGLLAWLFFSRSRKTEERIFAHAERAWWSLKHVPPPPAPRATWSESFARVVRTKLGWVHRSLAHYILPQLFGWATALLILLLAVATFPLSLVAIYKLWQFLRGTDVSPSGTGTPSPATDKRMVAEA